MKWVLESITICSHFLSLSLSNYTYEFYYFYCILFFLELFNVWVYLLI